MRTTSPSDFCLLALFLVGRVVGHNVTIDDPGERISLSLPPGGAEAPADELLATLNEAHELAAAIPVFSVDTTVKGTVTLVGFKYSNICS